MTFIFVAVLAPTFFPITMLFIALALCSKRKADAGSKSQMNPPPPETAPNSTQNPPLPTASKKELAAPAVTPQRSQMEKQPTSGGVAVPTAIGGDPATPTAGGINNGSGGDKKTPQKSDGGGNGTNMAGASVQKTTKDAGTAQSAAGNVSNNGSVVPGQDGVDQEGKPKVEKTVMLTLREKKKDHGAPGESDAGENDGGEAIDAGAKDGTEKKKKT